MPADEELDLLNLAVEVKAIEEKQARFIREEMRMFPGQRAGNMMVQKKLLDAAQVQRLRDLLVQRKAVGSPDAAPPAPAPAGSPPGAAGGAPRAVAPAYRVPGGPVRPAGAAAEPVAAPAPGAVPRPAPSAGVSAAPAAPAPAPAAPAPAAFEIPSGVKIPRPAGLKTLADFLRFARQSGASDLHLTPERVPYFRIGGRIVYLEGEPLSAAQAQQLNFDSLTPARREIADRQKQLDFALEAPGEGRYRCNVYRQRLGWEGNYRVVPSRVPTFEELGLPDPIRAMTAHARGLVAVTGGSGSGKTTTVAAMLELINRTREDHIITVEDPVEYVFVPATCQISQREVGSHTKSFGAALRGALREDPDIIMVGEMRDFETVSIAISAAETGHLVFGTLHTSSAARTVARILDVYPLSQREQVCMMVSESMKGIVAQQLVPRKDGKGRALAQEILVVTAGVGAQIRDGKTHQIASLIQTGKRVGMKLMDEALMELVNAGAISGRDAYLRAENKAPFEAHKDR